ncbi:hypothetical protein, partial [Propionivibrio sp.]|uniref:hypothetical protein n=1 Tax=Propionivibrio sp. TaxID=2212460 RepID=UPI003BF2B2C8
MDKGSSRYTPEDGCIHWLCGVSGCRSPVCGYSRGCNNFHPQRIKGERELQMFVDLPPDVPDAKPMIVLAQSQQIQQSTKARQPGRVRKFFSLRTRNPLAPTCWIRRVVRNASRFTPYQTARGAESKGESKPGRVRKFFSLRTRNP